MEKLHIAHVNRLINDYEEKFQKALTDSAEPRLLSYLKTNLAYLKEIKAKENRGNTIAA
jgi:hypothetical protein